MNAANENSMSSGCAAQLVDLGNLLKSRHYQFITPTPLTHKRVLRNRGDSPAKDLRDIFGWNLPFHETLLPAPLLDGLVRERLITPVGVDNYRSEVRVSSLAGDLYVHSRFPTSEEDAVFFGPDTYRFAALIRQDLSSLPLAPDCSILDMGCGGGPGGIVSARVSGVRVRELVLADVNQKALALSEVNVRLAKLASCRIVQSDLFTEVVGNFDLIVSNPPYLLDAERRTYRHGGGDYGESLSQRVLEQSVERLAPGGRLILYTGSAIVQGKDSFSEWAANVAAQAGCRIVRSEIDPDVFGEELDQPAYAGVDRIAAIGLVVQRPS